MYYIKIIQFEIYCILINTLQTEFCHTYEKSQFLKYRINYIKLINNSFFFFNFTYEPFLNME